MSGLTARGAEIAAEFHHLEGELKDLQEEAKQLLDSDDCMEVDMIHLLNRLIDLDTRPCDVLSDEDLE